MKTKSKIGMRYVIFGCIIAILCGGLAHAQNERWVYTYDDPQLVNAEAYSLVYGTDDNIYVAGYVRRISTCTDFAIISLDTLGLERWTYTLNGLSDYPFDQANDIVCGLDENIYAAGCTTPWNSYNFALAVASIDPYGSHRWTYIYDASVNTDEAANAIIASGPQRVSVAGYSSGAGTGKDITLISLRTVNGAELWVYTYDGPANSADVANSVAWNGSSGSASRLYITGYSTGVGTGKDFTVIATTGTGSELWVYRYDGPASGDDAALSIIYGPDSNIYAAGYSTGSGTDKDFTIISLDTLGNERWIHRASNNNDDEAKSIVYGTDDNLYIAGYQYIGPAQKENFVVTSIDTSGTQRWSFMYDGPTSISPDEANSIVYGNDGNIYAAGYSKQDTANGEDCAIIRLDTLGNAAWVYTYSSADTLDVFNSIVYSTDGNLYAAGQSDDKFTVISLDPTTNPALWSFPSFIMAMIDSGTTDDRTLKIANVGPETSILEWSLSERPPVDWLSEDSTSGSLSSGDTVVITITFDATNLVPGVYYDTLEITSNDPDHLTKDIPVKLTVGSPGVEDYTDTWSARLDDRCELLSSFFNEAISLRFTKSADTPCNIVLYNVLGARIYGAMLPSTPGLVTLDDKHISRLSRGIYFLSIVRAEKVYPVMKLVKF